MCALTSWPVSSTSMSLRREPDQGFVCPSGITVQQIRIEASEIFTASHKSRLTLRELKSHLWNCAEILRGSAVDRTDWKAFILPLLFFRRICDVWDEETAEATELYGDVDPVDYPEIHRFVVPEGCRCQVCSRRSMMIWPRRWRRPSGLKTRHPLAADRFSLEHSGVCRGRNATGGPIVSD